MFVLQYSRGLFCLDFFLGKINLWFLYVCHTVGHHITLKDRCCSWVIQRNQCDLSPSDLFKCILWFKMEPSMAAVLWVPRKLCSFSYVLLVFLLFYVLDVVSITVYNRHKLLNIGSSVAQCKPDFEFLNADALFTDRALCMGRSTKETPHEKREESWHPRQTETPCFPTSSSNHFAG